MSTHTGRAFLNSCLKVPIDPCNNCPAPVYNRPKLYMGKQTAPSAKASSKGKSRAKTAATGTDTQTGIRSLAKFYDSIPDYCDVKHLHQAEFYSTLESLRTTSRELRTQAAAPQDRCASASSNSLANYCGVKLKTKKRQGKGKKKKASLFLPPSTPMPAPVSPTPTPPTPPPAVREIGLCRSSKLPPSSCLQQEYSQCLRDLSRLNSFKQDFAVEVADFKRTLKGFEQEFKHHSKSTSSSCSQTPKQAPPPPRHTAERAKCRREMLRRCFSVNDLSVPTLMSDELPVKSKGEAAMSNYFPAKGAICGDVPKIHIESPSVSSKRSSSAASSRLRGRAKSKAHTVPTADHQMKAPLSIYALESPKRAVSCASPLHPVARPNLAATLRVEVSRRKVKELQNNCTYHDVTPQFDWEVRKTPAWKSLSLNESHKALLNIRLATRKAEQDLQERQYELHMEMMRQRVKSAPLLLEGPTFWGPEVGKLTHTCRSEGLRHACEGQQQRSKQRSGRKKCGSSRCATAATDSSCGGGDGRAKLQQLRKIYGAGSAKSRQSQRCSRREPPETQAHDSGDDLCSVDRAFL